jgi:aromatic-L-amino-acid/L-tryptophan decarboxylase
MTPEEFRRYGHQIVDWVADYGAGVAERPVMPPVEPGDIKAKLPAAPPERAEPFDAVLRDVEQILLPGLMHWQSPRSFGYFPANSELSSVLGDYLSTGLGVLGLSWQASTSSYALAKGGPPQTPRRSRSSGSAQFWSKS